MSMSMSMAEDWNEPDPGGHNLTISPTVSLGNLWSMTTTIVGGIASLLVFAWWLSGYLHGFQDSIDKLQETTSQIQVAQQTTHEYMTVVDKRLIPLELDFASASSRRAAIGERLAKLDSYTFDEQRTMSDNKTAIADQQKEIEDLQKKLDASNAEIQNLYAKYTAVYRDLAGFKCRIRPADCKASYEE